MRDRENQKNRVIQGRICTQLEKQMNIKLSIERGGIKMPSRKKLNPIKRVLARMGIGDRVVFDSKYYARLVPLFYHYGRTLGVKVTIRRLSDDKYGAWRVAGELL